MPFASLSLILADQAVDVMAGISAAFLGQKPNADGGTDAQKVAWEPESLRP